MKNLKKFPEITRVNAVEAMHGFSNIVTNPDKFMPASGVARSIQASGGLMSHDLDRFLRTNDLDILKERFSFNIASLEIDDDEEPLLRSVAAQIRGVVASGELDSQHRRKFREIYEENGIHVGFCDSSPEEIDISREIERMRLFIMNVVPDVVLLEDRYRGSKPQSAFVMAFSHPGVKKMFVDGGLDGDIYSKAVEIRGEDKFGRGQRLMKMDPREGRGYAADLPLLALRDNVEPYGGNYYGGPAATC